MNNETDVSFIGGQKTSKTVEKQPKIINNQPSK